MSKEDIRQLVTETGENIYGKYDTSFNIAVSAIKAAILNDVEELITDLLYELQEMD